MRAFTPSDNSKFTRLIGEVFSGHFPASDVSKMNLASLEKFVLRLVEYSSANMSAKTLSRIKCKDKPKWWPSDVLIEECNTKEKIKEFRITLKQLVLNCCNFFKAYNITWLPNTKSWINDENFDIARGVKRGVNEVYHSSSQNKRRKTLLSKNFTADVPNESANIFSDLPDITLFDDHYDEPPVDSDPVDQVSFLKLFNLGLNNNMVIKNERPIFSRQVKFHNCPHIPLSSDTGKLMMKNENYSVPEYVTTRKLERVEWYVNKHIPKVIDTKYEISFVPNKCKVKHFYKFPKRQLHQVKGNHIYSEFLFKLCKSLIVIIKNEDLLAKKRELDSYKLSVTLSRVPKQILNKHLCNDVVVMLNKKQVGEQITDLPKVSKFGRKIKPLIN